MYDVYIDGMLLPIAPEKIVTNINGRNETTVLINDGEINILKSAGLTVITFTALLPNVVYPFAQYPGGFLEARHYLDKLERLKTEKRAFQFIIARKTPVNRQLFNTNMTCSLEGYSIIDDAKNGFDVEVQITLKQYRPYGTKTFHVDKPSPTAPMVAYVNRPDAIAHTVAAKEQARAGQGGGRTKTYKVQIPGMSAVTVKANSVAAAIKQAVGSWTGTVYVDGKTYYANKGVMSDPPTKKITTPPAVNRAFNQVKKAADKVWNVVTTTVSNWVNAARNPPAKKVTNNRSNQIVMKN